MEFEPEVIQNKWFVKKRNFYGIRLLLCLPRKRAQLGPSNRPASTASPPTLTRWIESSAAASEIEIRLGLSILAPWMLIMRVAWVAVTRWYRKRQAPRGPLTPPVAGSSPLRRVRSFRVAGDVAKTFALGKSMAWPGRLILRRLRVRSGMRGYLNGEVRIEHSRANVHRPRSKWIRWMQG